MSDIHALSGAYAVDALDDLERAQFQRHLATCDICNSEVESLREASALLAETTMVAPSPELRDRVLAEIATVRPLPPVVEPSSARTVPGRRRWLSAVAAAAAVVALGAGAAIVQPWDDSSQTQVTEADAVLQAADAETFANSFSGSGGQQVTVVRSLSLQKAVIVPEGMPPAPGGHRYALWLQHDNRMVPAGFMDDSGTAIVLTGDAVTATGAAISVEDDGADPTTPSDDVVALFDFDQV